MMLAHLALGFGLIASAANATEWTPLTSTSSGTKLSYDRDRTRVGVQDETTIWVRYDHSRDRTVSKRLTIAMFLVECSTRRFASRRITTYAASGALIDSYDNDSPIKSPVPDSVGEDIVRAACDSDDV